MLETKKKKKKKKGPELQFKFLYCFVLDFYILSSFSQTLVFLLHLKIIFAWHEALIVLGDYKNLVGQGRQVMYNFTVEFKHPENMKLYVSGKIFLAVLLLAH